jgi:hypothetical protein
VELVHDHGRHAGEVEPVGVQEPVEEDFSDDDQDAGVRVHFPVASDQADVVA